MEKFTQKKMHPNNDILPDGEQFTMHYFKIKNDFFFKDKRTFFLSLGSKVYEI